MTTTLIRRLVLSRSRLLIAAGATLAFAAAGAGIAAAAVKSRR